MGISSLEELQGIFRREGVETVYVKFLATKQDNDKNQIYLGKTLAGATNLFPARIRPRSPSESRAKRASKERQAKLEALLNFVWIDADGNRHTAPHAKIIDYFQYPEVRFSGFLKGCSGAPVSLRRTRQAEFGRRILCLGVDQDGIVVGLVLTERDDALVGAFPALPPLPTAALLSVFVTTAPVGVEPVTLLINELKAIYAAGWHSARILRRIEQGPLPFRGNQGGGYTLEALLGVEANANKEPDKFGYEIKSYRGDKLSLMTPSPDGGFQKDNSFRDFMNRYGWEGKRDPDTRRFTGVYRAGKETNGFVLRVLGYDHATGQFSANPNDVAVALECLADGCTVASWSLTHLANSWNKKHASAAYIACEARPISVVGGADAEYRYGNRVLIGEGTDVWRLIKAIADGLVYYDPAHSIYADDRAKVRPQWRIATRKLQDAMQRLYQTVTVHQLQ